MTTMMKSFLRIFRAGSILQQGRLPSGFEHRSIIEMLSRVKYGQDGFDIHPPAKRLVGDRGCRVVNGNEMEFEEEELCDALWNALVEFL